MSTLASLGDAEHQKTVRSVCFGGFINITGLADKNKDWFEGEKTKDDLQTLTPISLTDYDATLSWVLISSQFGTRVFLKWRPTHNYGQVIRFP